MAAPIRKEAPTPASVGLRCGVERLGRPGRSDGAVFAGNFAGVACAVKKVSLDASVDGRRPAAPAMSRVRHRNVVRLLGLAQDHQFRYYALELCCASLEDYCSGTYTGPMPVAALGLFQMASGLAHIHRQDLIHGDLRAANILVTSEAQFKIADFGLGVARNGIASKRVGELPYLAPELLDGAPVSPAADCFAMGCVFGVFLTKGTHPFGRGLEAVANIVAARGAHFAGRSELEPYGDLIGRMVEHQPERRPVLSRVVQRLEPKPESPPQPQLELQPQRAVQADVKMADNGAVLHCRAFADRAAAAGSGQRIRCCFHPHLPLMACAFRDGQVRVMRDPSFEFGTVQLASSTFDDWSEGTWKASVASSIACIQWSADGERLAVACVDGGLTVWDQYGGTSLQVPGADDSAINCLAWNAEPGRTHLLLAAGDDKTAAVWDAAAGGAAVQRLRLHLEAVRDACWIGADAVATASDDRTIEIVGLASSKASPSTFKHSGSVRHLQWNPWQRRLASYGWDGAVKIWSLERAKACAVLRTDGRITCFHWHCRNGPSLLACGSEDGKVTLWRTGAGAEWSRPAPSGPAPAALHRRRISDVAFSGDGRRLAAVDAAGHLVVWTAPSWTPVFQTRVAETLRKCLSWDPTGRRLAVDNDAGLVCVVQWDQPGTP